MVLPYRIWEFPAGLGQRPVRPQSVRYAGRMHPPAFAHHRFRWLALTACVLALPAQALTLTALTPQGEVARVRQVAAQFDDNAVNFGDAGAPAPLTVSCDDAAAGRGQGRWVSARQWVFDFAADLPPGVRCRVEPVSGFKSPSGALLKSASS